MLEVQELSVRYGKHIALAGPSLKVSPGEIVVILGANGAGKSTLLKAIAGVCEGQVSGAVSVSGEPVMGLPPHKVVERGIALVPEGRGIFGELTVRENLMLGANPQRAREEVEARFEQLTRLFPKLSDRARQVVRTMSGGEQQMVAIGRALMSRPNLLMLDEPSLGLSPKLIDEYFATVAAIHRQGTTVLLIEQNAETALSLADRGYLLIRGRIAASGTSAELLRDDTVRKLYL